MTLTPPIPPEGEDGDPASRGKARRSNVRSNMFVVAALTSSVESGPVRIRNMSCHGALIEGAAIPSENSKLRLSRGSFSVSGEVVWRRDDRAGIRFETPVTVAEWMPLGRRADHQQRIDEIVHTYKSGGGSAGAAGDEALEQIAPGIAEELLQLARTLSSVANGLANDAATATLHYTALQRIDLTAHKLEAIARRLG